LAAPPPDPPPPVGLNVCDLGLGPATTPSNSIEALSGLIQLWIACEDGLLLSLETVLQRLASEHGDELESSLSLTTGALASLKQEMEDFQKVVTDPKLTVKQLTESYAAVLIDMEALEGALAILWDAAEQAGLELQNAQQKADQYVNLISNVLKTKHDTAKASIANVR